MTLGIGTEVMTRERFTHDCVNFTKGTTGIIVDLTSTSYGIAWDEEKDDYHTCGNRCLNHYGYYVPMDKIVPLDTIEAELNS